MRTVATNAVNPATTTSASFDFIPVAGKGGKTTNAEIDDRNQIDEKKVKQVIAIINKIIAK